MSSDRGTLHRGAIPGPDHQPPGWPDPTAPGSRRLPTAHRERKPALAALALLLIAGGALGAGYLVLRSGQRVAAIEISQQIGAGQRIPLAAMQEVQVASGTGLKYVPWSEASQVARYYAGTAIPPGTLLTSAMVVGANSATAGKAVLGLALKDGQMPDGLQVGDHIDIYEVSNATPVCPGTPGQALAQDAVVLAITSPSAASGSSATDVQVALTPAAAGQVACNAANGLVGVAVLPANRAAAAAAAPPAPPPGRAARSGRRRAARVTPTPTATG